MGLSLAVGISRIGTWGGDNDGGDQGDDPKTEGGRHQYDLSHDTQG